MLQMHEMLEHRHKKRVSGQILSLYRSLGKCKLRMCLALFFLIPTGLIIMLHMIVTTLTIFYVLVALVISIMAIIFAIYIMANILSKDKGSHTMREISVPIKEGSEGFFRAQYGTISKLALGVALLLFLVYILKSEESNAYHKFISQKWIAGLTAFSFTLGAICSGISGYAGIWVSVRANVRVASAARKCYHEAMTICLRGGAFSAIINVALAILGICFLYLLTYTIMWLGAKNGEPIPEEKIPLMIVGFGFGASFVAMFAQLGGGIFTKAADVGADLIGKIEAGIPEDDPRNPAVIADLVGDNVGDCAGQCADLFESISAEVISAMILGGTLVEKANLPLDVKAGFILFPLAVHCLDLVVSTIGVLMLKTKEGLPDLRPDYGELEDPLTILKRGYIVSIILGTIGFFALCYFFLNPKNIPDVWLNLSLCGLVGIAISLIFIFVTQYYTDYKFPPVRRIAFSSQSGHAPNIIAGLSVGLESTGIPCIVISCGIIISYYLGKSCGFTIKDADFAGVPGLYATAIATMGMFSTGVYVLSMSGFGPIADNAGGIAEMSGQVQSVRDITDRLDAVGNVTKANTKGYSVGSAALACFLLFAAFMDEVEMLLSTANNGNSPKIQFKKVDIAVPEVYVGGLLGTVTVFIFSGWAIAAVGKTAEAVMAEVRRQFRENPGIMEFKTKPNYRQCVELVAKAGLREMIKPGLLSVLAPIIVGLIFRFIGEAQGRVLLGAEVIAGFLMFATSTGIMMALFFNNGGGAWDNAKKYIETGMHGGKNSFAHQSAVTGDTVGDPCKDTAGPSIHILIKLLATITLVMVPLYVGGIHPVATE